MKKILKLYKDFIEILLKNILGIFPKSNHKSNQKVGGCGLCSLVCTHCFQNAYILIHSFSHKVFQCDGRANTLFLVKVKFYSLRTTHKIYANLQILNMPNCHMFWWWWKFVVAWIIMTTSCFCLQNYFVIIKGSQSFKMTPFANNLSMNEKRNNKSTHEWPSRIKKNDITL
jgi:hypothetical protein